MSSQNLKRFLWNLVQDLETTSNSVLRRGWANKQEHVFTTSGPQIAKQTFDELNIREIELSSSQKQEIRKASNRAFTQIKKAVKSTLDTHNAAFGFTNHSDTKFTSSSLVAVFQSYADNSTGDIFEKIRNSYKTQVQNYYNEVRKIVGKGKGLPTRQSGFFELGHKQDEGVLEASARETADYWELDIYDDALIPFLISSRKEVGVKFRAFMAPSADRLTVSIESKKENRSDSSKARAKKREFIDAANRAIDKLTKGQGFTELAGSDSPKERKRKQAIEAAVNPFRKIKGAKISTEDIKPKTSKGSAESAKKQTIQRTTASFRSTVTGRFIKKKKGLESYLNIKRLINAALPETVAKNMGAPKLVWRTGRFSGQAGEGPRVLSVRPTVGSPEATYTYQKYPYQVFESHSTRDPRIIIEESIREIAYNLALGKFGLRRV